MSVGIFDSGLGGLTVYRAIAQRLPDLPIVYYGDNAHTPYGVRDSDDIFDLTTKGVQRLFDARCDLVILACNTASAAALRQMQESWVPDGKRVLGVTEEQKVGTVNHGAGLRLRMGRAGVENRQAPGFAMSFCNWP